MPVVSLDSLSFPDLAWTFQLLPSKHTEASIGHVRPFASIILETSILSLVMVKVESLHCGKAVCLYSQSEISIIYPLCILTQMCHLQKMSSKT
jgi:hypothetical protein